MEMKEKMKEDAKEKIKGRELWCSEMLERHMNRIIWEYDTEIARDLGLIEAVVYEYFRTFQETYKKLNLNSNICPLCILNGEEYRRYDETTLNKIFDFLSHEDVMKAIKALERNYLIDILQNMDFVYIKTNETVEEIKNKEHVKELENN